MSDPCLHTVLQLGGYDVTGRVHAHCFRGQCRDTCAPVYLTVVPSVDHTELPRAEALLFLHSKQLIDAKDILVCRSVCLPSGSARRCVCMCVCVCVCVCVCAYTYMCVFVCACV